jgi:heat shock protein HslJ
VPRQSPIVAVVVVVSLLPSGCAPRAKDVRLVTSASAADPEAAAPAPAWEEVRNATFHGFTESGDPVTLKDGRWEGPSFVAGGASRPTVELINRFLLSADLDGDGAEEAVVLMRGSTGGSGENIYLAVVGRHDGRVENLGTALLGDRVQVRRAAIEGRFVRIDLVQAEPSDPACCPGGLFSRTFALSGGALVEPVTATRTDRLGLAMLADRVWLLRAWNVDEPAPTTPAVTLTFKEGRFAGDTGCNGYFATVKEGDLPGGIALGPVGSTRMACEPSLTEVESRFLAQLGSTTRFGFLLGRLALSYRTDAGYGAMLFEEKL